MVDASANAKGLREKELPPATSRKPMTTRATKRAGRPKRDDRFRQLTALANEGNAEAAADLWREYGFEFGKEEA